MGDGDQGPYIILTVETVGHFAPPEPTWLEGWIDPRAKTIYGNTVGIVHAAHA